MTKKTKSHYQETYNLSQVERGILKKGGIFRYETRGHKPPKYTPVKTTVDDIPITIYFAEVQRDLDELPKSYKSNPDAPFNLNEKHLSILLAVLAKAAATNMTVQEALDADLADPRVGMYVNPQAAAWCSMSFYELIEIAGLTYNGKTYETIVLMLQDLFAVQYKEGSPPSANRKTTASAGPCLHYVFEEDADENEVRKIEFAVNVRLSGALLEFENAKRLSSLHVNLDEYRTLSPLQKLIYVRLLAYASGARASKQKVKFTTIYEDVFGVAHDDESITKRTYENRIKAIKDACTEIGKLESFQVDEINTRRDKNLHYSYKKQ